MLISFLSFLMFFFFCRRSDEEWSDDEKGGGKEDDLEELDEMQLGELLAKEQRARHMGLSQVRVCGGVYFGWRTGNAFSIVLSFLFFVFVSRLLSLPFSLSCLSVCLCFNISLSLSLSVSPA